MEDAMPSRLTPSALAVALGTTAAVPASADPTFGIGFSLSFGGGQPQVGAGVRVFSDDDEDEVAASVGLDYVFTSQSLRPTIGAAYLFDNGYVGADVGYNLSAGTFDVGGSAGFADTDDDDGPGLAGGGEGEGEGEIGGEGGGERPVASDEGVGAGPETIDLSPL